MAQVKSGSFSGNGTATVDLNVGFEPDIILIDSGIDTETPGTQGLLMVAIAKGAFTINYYHNSATDNGEHTYNNRLNTSADPWGSDSGAYRSMAEYSDGVLSVTNKTKNNANIYFINGQNYTWTAYKA